MNTIVPNADCRPHELLNALSRRYPNIWNRIELYRYFRARAGGRSQPAYVYCSLEGVYGVLQIATKRQKLNSRELADVPAIAALSAWRYTQGIYCYDASLYSALIGTRIEGDIPCELLSRLPSWCVYVETPGLRSLNESMYGAFVHLDWDPKEQRDELRFVLDTERGLKGIGIQLGPWPLGLAIEETIASSERASGAHANHRKRLADWMRQVAEPLISLALYLCTDEPDIPGDAWRDRPQPKHTKEGDKLFAAERSLTWDVGMRIGATIRATEAIHGSSKEEGSGGTVRPHWRKAHYHSF